MDVSFFNFQLIFKDFLFGVDSWHEWVKHSTACGQLSPLNHMTITQSPIKQFTFLAQFIWETYISHILYSQDCRKALNLYLTTPPRCCLYSQGDP